MKRGNRGVIVAGLLTLSLAAAMAAEPPAAGTPATPTESGDENLGRDIVELYEQAVAATEKVCDDYRRIRAMQLAKQRDIAFSEAYELVQSVMPILKPINRELLRKAIRDPNDLKKHEDEVNKVRKEIEVMIELTTKLLLEIEKVQQEMTQHQERHEIKLEEIVQKERFTPEQIKNMKRMEQGEERKELMKRLAKEAKENEKQRAKDLTRFMPPPQPNIKDLTKQDQDKQRRRILPPFHSDGTTGRSFRINPKNIALARKFRVDGEPVEWMFVDTWYTIGPFPNPFRRNLGKKFPPETVVDLDASYIGKNGKRIAWKFRQSRQPRVIPADAEEYGIWYAYSEVYMDRPADLWVAIGSDDKGNIWVNDMPIWISGDRLKGWRIDEGFRKVRFKAGRNRILYRIENGHLAINFSFGIRVAK